MEGIQILHLLLLFNSCRAHRKNILVLLGKQVKRLLVIVRPKIKPNFATDKSELGHLEMIKLLGALTEEHLEITLQVKSGPKTSGKTTVAFGTENRVIAISEPMPDEQAWMPFNYRNIDAIEAMYS